MPIKNTFTAALLAAGLIGGSSVVMAQEELANIEYTYSSPSNDDLGDDIFQQQGKVALTLPISSIKKGDAYNLSLGGAFQADIWDAENSGSDVFDVYKVKVPVSAGFMVADKSLLTLAAIPGLHTDFEEVNENDFRVDGLGMFTYMYSKTLKLSAGLSYWEEFGDPTLGFAGGLEWQATDALLLRLMTIDPRIQYAFTDGFRVYIGGEGTGGQWNVGEGQDGLDVQQKGYRVGLGTEFRVLRSGWLYVMGGQEVNRKLQMAVDGNESPEVDLEDSPFIQVGFRILG